MNQQEALELARTTSPDVEVEGNEDRYFVYPTDKGEPLCELGVQATRNGSTWIVAQQTGGGRGDVDWRVYTAPDVVFDLH